jgi:adenine deaminase
MRLRLFQAAAACLLISAITQVSAQQKYDLLLKGGHHIDPKNNISAVRDVAIADDKVAADRRRSMGRHHARAGQAAATLKGSRRTTMSTPDDER